MRTCRQRHHRSRRGAATVEAVILLPVLAVLFAGLFFTHAHASRRQQARVLARRCAWLHAIDGCREIPPGCEDVPHSSLRADEAADADTVTDGLKNHAREGGLLDGTPMLESLLDDLLGSPTQYTATRDVARAGFEGTAAGRVHLLCNPKPLDPWALVEDSFCTSTDLCQP